MSSRFTLRRTVTALALGAAAAASLVITAPAAVADEPQTKLMRLLDECDKETFDAALPGLCTVDAGSVTFDRFSADLQRGGSGVIPPFNVAVNNAPVAVKLNGSPVTFGDIGPTGVGPGTPGLDVVPTKGVHNYQCIFHPWMRSVVTVR